MQRALDLVRGVGYRTSPNPTVGCVVVRDGRIVGEGVTLPPGQAHAEVVALHAAGEAARGADVYVTLEPCCHHGRTPPCTAALIDSGIARVFAGVIDPNPLVAGEGMRQLEAAGVETHVGALGEACSHQIAPFRRHILDRRPWVILKAAVTLDGRIATAGGESKWITGEAARRDVHRQRALADAVMVGAETARRDDPRLDVRLVPGENPLAVVLDPNLSVCATAAVARPGALIFHAEGVESARAQRLRDAGAQTEGVRTDAGRLDLVEVLAALGRRGAMRLLVEGGGRLHGALLAAGLADELLFYVAPVLLGRGRPVVDRPSAASMDDAWRLDDVEIRPLGDDVRIAGRIRYPSAPNVKL